MGIYLLLFLTGGGLYVLLELLWRGRSHVSMAVAGGAALVLLYGVFTRYPALPLFLRCLIGSALITAIEFVTGALVNLRLRLAVWDYSAVRGNVFGQVCPRFTLLWFLLTAPASALVDFVYTSFSA